MRSRGLRITRVDSDAAHGEWIAVDHPNDRTILYIHGGGYVSCSPATHRPITSALAKLSGCRIFSVDYRRAPEHRFPAALDDVISAYRWLLDQNGVSPTSLAVSGDSAGGGLALALLVALRDRDIELPSCAVLGSPWTDLTGSGASTHENEGKCHMFRPRNITDFAAVYLGKASAADSRASPVFADLSGLPPILLQVGSTELLLDDARRVHDKLQSAGSESRLHVYHDMLHAWHMLDGLVPESRTALTEAVEFISAHASKA